MYTNLNGRMDMILINGYKIKNDNKCDFYLFIDKADSTFCSKLRPLKFFAIT